MLTYWGKLLTSALKTKQKKKGMINIWKIKKLYKIENSVIPLDSAVSNIYRVIIPSRLEQEA